MLTANKITADSYEYYLNSLEGPDQNAVWLGIGAQALGLTNAQFEPVDFVLLLQGKQPDLFDQKPLLSGLRTDHVPGWDFTFSASKDISLAWAIDSDADRRQDVLNAHDRAVQRTLTWLEENSAVARVTRASVKQTTPVGLVVAAFRHTVNRNSEPGLHTHAVIMNVGIDEDGEWRSIHSKYLYNVQKAARKIYAAELRANISQLGYRFHTIGDGSIVLDGVNRSLISTFSTRTTEIKEYMKQMQRIDPAANAIATIATRAPKETHSFDELHTEWLETLAGAGYSQEAFLASIRDPSGTPAPHVALDADWVAMAIAAALGPNGVTGHNAIFFTEDLYAFYADLGINGITVDELTLLVEATLANPELLPITLLDADGALITNENRGHRPTQVVKASALGPMRARERFTIRSMLDVEQATMVCADESHPTPLGVATPLALETALEHYAVNGFTPSPQQIDIISNVTTSGKAIELISGIPGSGKTDLLTAATSAWKSSGYWVLGMAHTGVVADKLKQQAGMEAYTLASAIDSLSKGYLLLTNKTVIVIDEAAMVGTRDLYHVLRAASNAHAKVLLVGDDSQLPAINAGGMFTALWQHQGGHQLDVNLRQIHDWAKDAADKLRKGHAEAAIWHYASEGFVLTADTELDLLYTCVTNWRKDLAQGHATAMYTYLNHHTYALNLMARSLLIESGELGATALYLPASESDSKLDAREYSIGEEILLLKNNFLRHARGFGSTRVRNSHTATIISYNESDQTVVASLADGTLIRIPNHYLVNHTNHAYARTIYKAQGGTVGKVRSDPELTIEGHAHIFGAESLHLEAAYIAVTRATHTTKLYVMQNAFDQLKAVIEEEAPGADVAIGSRDSLTSLTDAWNRTSVSSSVLLALKDQAAIREFATTYSTHALSVFARRLESRLNASRHSITTPVAEAGVDLVAWNEVQATLDSSYDLFESPRYEAEVAELMGNLQRTIDTARTRSHIRIDDDFRFYRTWAERSQAALDLKRTTAFDAVIASPPSEIIDAIGSMPDDSRKRSQDAWMESVAALFTLREIVDFGSDSPVETPLERAIGFSLVDQDKLIFTEQLETLRASMKRLAVALATEPYPRPTTKTQKDISIIHDIKSPDSTSIPVIEDTANTSAQLATVQDNLNELTVSLLPPNNDNPSIIGF